MWYCTNARVTHHSIYGRLHIPALTFGSASKHACRCQARERERESSHVERGSDKWRSAVSLCLSPIIAPCDHCATSLQWLPNINRRIDRIIEEQKKRDATGRKRLSLHIFSYMIGFEMQPTSTVILKPDRQWRSSSFQESKKVRVSRDLWPWPWVHPGCTLTWSPSCASLVAIRSFVCEKKRFAQKFKDGRTNRRRTPRHCISSFLEWAKNSMYTVSQN